MPSQRVFRCAKPRVDVLVGGDVHDEGDVRVQLLGERHDALGHAFDVREGELRPLAMHCLGDPPGNGTVGGKPDDQRALALQKTHV